MSFFYRQVYQWLEENGDREKALPLFAVLDGGRNPIIHKLAKQFEGEMLCLYKGNLPPDTAEIAPYLLRLTYGSRGMQRILERMWGNQWGILLQAQAGIEEIRDHFRRFVLVRDQNWRKYYLRFYDPHILRPFLKSCNVQELKNFFGPIQRFMIESYTPDILEEYHLQDGILKAESHKFEEEVAEVE